MGWRGNGQVFTELVLLMGAVNGAVVKVTPEGPIIAMPGSAVHINCSLLESQDEIIVDDSSESDSDEALDTHLVWKFDRHKKSQQHNPRFSYMPLSPTLLQLVIDPVQGGDAGIYSCYSGPGYDSANVRLFVVTPVNETRPCATTEMRCGDGNCIFLRYRCDKVTDCMEEDAADEKDCDFNCSDKFLFRCNNGQCIETRHVCDRFATHHCRDGSDESRCGRNHQYTGEIKPASDLGTDLPVSHHTDHGLHYHAVYSGIASVVGLVVIAAVVVGTVCRIHMKREQQRHLEHMEIRRRPRYTRRLQWQTSTGPGYGPPSVEDYRLSGPPAQFMPTSPNVEVNINMQLSPHESRQLIGQMGANHRMSTLIASNSGINLMLSPPPYTPQSEPESPPREGTPPPPYSTMDRRTRPSDPALHQASPPYTPRESSLPPYEEEVPQTALASEVNTNPMRPDNHSPSPISPLHARLDFNMMDDPNSAKDLPADDAYNTDTLPAPHRDRMGDRDSDSRRITEEFGDLEGLEGAVGGVDTFGEGSIVNGSDTLPVQREDRVRNRDCEVDGILDLDNLEGLEGAVGGVGVTDATNDDANASLLDRDNDNLNKRDSAIGLRASHEELGSLSVLDDLLESVQDSEVSDPLMGEERRV